MPKTVKYRVWKKEEIQDLMKKNDSFLCRSLMKVNSMHNAIIEQTLTGAHKNPVNEVIFKDGVGFNKYDADFLCSVADSCKEHDGHLTEKQISVVRPKMLKYAGQLAKVTNASNKAKYERETLDKEIESLEKKLEELKSKRASI